MNTYWNPYWLVAAMVASAVVANLLLKLGATVPDDAGMSALFNWRIALGLGMFALAAVLYVMVLRKLPLNVAQAFMVAQFVGVILGSYFLLGEAISPLRATGIALITVGIAVVAVSQP